MVTTWAIQLLEWRDQEAARGTQFSDTINHILLRYKTVAQEIDTLRKLVESLMREAAWATKSQATILLTAYGLSTGRVIADRRA